MTLIHKDQVERIQIAGSFIDRLDSRHDDRVLGIPPFQAGRIDSDRQIRTDQFQLVDGLLQKFFDMGQDQHTAVPGLHRIMADGCHDRRLAATCRDHDDRVVIVIPQVLVNSVNSLLLIRTKRQHDQ